MYTSTAEETEETATVQEEEKSRKVLKLLRDTVTAAVDHPVII